MFVIPEWDMVIVRLGLDQTELNITDTIYGTFIQKLGQAITDVTSEGEMEKQQAIADLEFRRSQHQPRLTISSL